MKRFILIATAILIVAGGTHLHLVLDAPMSQGVVVPAGPAKLGSDDEEKAYGYSIGGAAARRWRWYDREVARTVTLPAYWMDLTLVTQGQYFTFVSATNHRIPHIGAADYKRQGFLVHPYKEVLPFLWKGGRPPRGMLDHPVVLISISDAQSFCAWRGNQEKRVCRLPTEDEWEKGARGTDDRYFPWGNTWEPNRLNSEARGPYSTTPVKQYVQGRSAYGLYDMAGNLFQWTATKGRPGKNFLKGCSWDDLGGICRSAARHDRNSDSRHILIGFRCACDAGKAPNSGKQ